MNIDKIGLCCVEEYEEDLENTRLATEPRPGTTFRATAVESVQQRVSTSRPKTSNGRYLTGTVNNEQRFIFAILIPYLTWHFFFVFFFEF